MGERHEGGCVCGAVRYVAHGDPERVTVCHCSWCQRRTGSAFGVEVVFREEAVTVAGEVRTYRHVSDESGRWLDQHFCGRCGSNIGITIEAVPGIRTIAAGTFDDPSWISPERYTFRYVYLRSARDWSRLPEGAKRYEEHFRP
ncbi:MAG TPA: GFA family protein [Geminicoccaceae bacterium]|nr:GFA family protein [Geminicoccaceae bacterium]